MAHKVNIIGNQSKSFHRQADVDVETRKYLRCQNKMVQNCEEAQAESLFLETKEQKQVMYKGMNCQ